MNANEKMKPIRDPVRDWECGVLTDVAALVAISIIVTPQEPSAESVAWATNSITIQDQ
jgi:hypothetical protein